MEQNFTERSTLVNIKYIGMDVHKEAISIAVMNGEGKLRNLYAVHLFQVPLDLPRVIPRAYTEMILSSKPLQCRSLAQVLPDPNLSLPLFHTQHSS